MPPIPTAYIWHCCECASDGIQAMGKPSSHGGKSSSERCPNCDHFCCRNCGMFKVRSTKDDGGAKQKPTPKAEGVGLTDIAGARVEAAHIQSESEQRLLRTRRERELEEERERERERDRKREGERERQREREREREQERHREMDRERIRQRRLLEEELERSRREREREGDRQERELEKQRHESELEKQRQKRERKRERKRDGQEREVRDRQDKKASPPAAARTKHRDADQEPQSRLQPLQTAKGNATAPDAAPEGPIGQPSEAGRQKTAASVSKEHEEIQGKQDVPDNGKPEQLKPAEECHPPENERPIVRNRGWRLPFAVPNRALAIKAMFVTAGLLSLLIAILCARGVMTVQDGFTVGAYIAGVPMLGALVWQALGIS